MDRAADAGPVLDTMVEITRPPVHRGAGVIEGEVIHVDGFGNLITSGLQLTVGGPYRYVRNPLYLAIALAITGQGLLLSRPVLLVYAAVFLAAFMAFVHWYEEPSLARRFGDQYETYRKQVPGWWPRLPRRAP